MQGRHSEFTIEKGERVCELIAQGLSLRKICEQEDIAHRTTILRWLNDFPNFRDQYARARQMQLEYWSHEIVEISDDGSNDTIETETGSKLNNEWMQRSRLRVDTRKWLMSKLAPKQYGDKLELGGPGGGPLVVQVVKFEPDDDSSGT